MLPSYNRKRLTKAGYMFVKTVGVSIIVLELVKIAKCVIPIAVGKTGEFIEKVEDEAKEFVGNIVDELHEAKEFVEDVVENVVENVKDELHEAKEFVENVVENVKDELHEAKEFVEYVANVVEDKIESEVHEAIMC